MKRFTAKAAAAALLVGLTSGAMADGATLGVGVAHGSANDFEASRIFVPIKPADNNLWFEPYASLSNQSGGGTVRALGLGTGIFVDFASTQNTQAYYGGRIGIINSSASGAGSDTAIELAPTLGFGYLPAKNIMFGAEAAIGLISGDGYTNIGTQTGLFVRYFFD